jgi:hemerythrin superfamily protein
MKKNTILNVMIKDHNSLIILLKSIQSNINKDFKSLQKSFNEFDWKFEKHLFVEERAIYSSDAPIDIVKKYPIILELFEEHIVLLDILSEIKRDLLRNQTVDISKFIRLLKNHKDFEEENVYPRLDKELNESQKNLIFMKINEIS